MANDEAFVDDYLPALLGRAWYLVSTDFHRTVQEHGLSVLEWRVLSTLASEGAMSISTLAQITISKQPTITRLLSRMEAQSYVASADSREDGRSRIVRVTRSGRRLVSGLIVLAGQHERKVLACFDREKVDELKRFLHELIDHYRPDV